MKGSHGVGNIGLSGNVENPHTKACVVCLTVDKILGAEAILYSVTLDSKIGTPHRDVLRDCSIF